MSTGAGTFEMLARLFGDSLRALATRNSDQAVETLFANVGVQLPEGFISGQSFAAVIRSASEWLNSFAAVSGSVLFADRYHVVGRTAQQCRSDLPRGRFCDSTNGIIVQVGVSLGCA